MNIIATPPLVNHVRDDATATPVGGRISDIYTQVIGPEPMLNPITNVQVKTTSR